MARNSGLLVPRKHRQILLMDLGGNGKRITENLTAKAWRGGLRLGWAGVGEARRFGRDSEILEIFLSVLLGGLLLFSEVWKEFFI